MAIFLLTTTTTKPITLPLAHVRGVKIMCICGACDVSIRQALKARDKVEPYQLRWMKGKVVSVCHLIAQLISRLKSIILLGR